MEKKLVIIGDWCKGCGICVEFCPVRVLEIKDGKVRLIDEDRCIKCGLCEMRCPDFAIYLEVKKDVEGVNAGK
ncbi:4Fe-4S binding protein [Caldanaerobacter sp.]|uniref:4Fe-4S dicluster domain-containing protein n=1 Tax=Caldanaerobacter sp. TaxID=2930036 RepID=UPI00258AFDCC|nr:4Fe-4S binding protein [Caldanaerobacter sp.]